LTATVRTRRHRGIPRFFTPVNLLHHVEQASTPKKRVACSLTDAVDESCSHAGG
jgi:hypothetical protein